MLSRNDFIFSSKAIEEIPWFMEDPDYFEIEVIKCADYGICTGEVFSEWEEYRVRQLAD